MSVYVISFIASAVAVFIAGAFLTRSADAIAESTGLGRAWIGAVLLATVTSLPELATDISAVRMGAPNLAVGDLFGSSLANMLILAAIDFFWRSKKVLRGAAIENALTACVAIILNALGALFVLTRPHWTLLGVAPESFLLVLVYLGGTRAIYRNGVRVADSDGPAPRPRLSGRTILTFGGSTLVILAASPALAWSAKNIAEVSGLGTTFVGTWLVGLSTSLPEIVTSYMAVRIGAFDLAVGNLFGSNSFNMVIFVALDLASPSRSIFAGLSPVHAIVGALAVILMSLGLASILYRAERRFLMIEPGSALMLVVYAVSIWVVYLYTHGG